MVKTWPLIGPQFLGSVGHLLDGWTMSWIILFGITTYPGQLMELANNLTSPMVVSMFSEQIYRGSPQIPMRTDRTYHIIGTDRNK